MSGCWYPRSGIRCGPDGRGGMWHQCGEGVDQMEGVECGTGAEKVWTRWKGWNVAPVRNGCGPDGRGEMWHRCGIRVDQMEGVECGTGAE